MHHPQLEQCPLFQGLTPEEQAYALSYFDAKTKTYEKGEFLHHVSFPLERFGLVLSGTVQVYMDDMDGHHIIMNSVGAGGLFGEAYCFLGTDAPIYICAVTESEILWMSPNRIKAPMPPFRPLDWALSNIVGVQNNDVTGQVLFRLCGSGGNGQGQHHDQCQEERGKLLP